MKPIILFLLTSLQVFTCLYPQASVRKSFYLPDELLLLEEVPDPSPDLALLEWQGTVTELFAPHSYELELRVKVENLGVESFQSLNVPEAYVKVYQGEDLLAQEDILALGSGQSEYLSFRILYQTLPPPLDLYAEPIRICLCYNPGSTKDPYTCNDDAVRHNNLLLVYDWQIRDRHPFFSVHGSDKESNLPK